MEVFKACLDDINSEFLTPENQRKQEEKLRGRISLRTRRLISSISFGQNCIIVMKKTQEEFRLYDSRTYRFGKNL